MIPKSPREIAHALDKLDRGGDYPRLTLADLFAHRGEWTTVDADRNLYRNGVGEVYHFDPEFRRKLDRIFGVENDN